jgi:protein-tyrosine phosphatase
MSDEQPGRQLSWEACYNVRDLGGYATVDGGVTRWRAFVRAGSLYQLTAAGRAALLGYGVRTIVDLRRAGEVEGYPNPFARPSEDASLPKYLNLPLGAGADRDGILAVMAAGDGEDASMLELFRPVLDHYWRGIARVMTAVAAAPDGAVLFHCYAGKDRTGMIAALLLALAGVPAQTIAEDYALSQVYLRSLAEERLSLEPDPHKRQILARMWGAEPDTMLGILSHLETRHGGAERYLLAAGVTPDEVERVRRRMV